MRFALALLLAATAAQAQYPAKPVRVVVGYAAGSSTDIVGRVMADRTDFDPVQPVGLAAFFAGAIILYLDDLAPGVRAALFAHEMRTFRRVTLRALLGGHPVEFPVGRSAAARFAARGFPFEISH